MKKIIFVLCLLYSTNAYAMGLSEHDLALFDALEGKNARPIPDEVISAAEIVLVNCLDLYNSSDRWEAKINQRPICRCVKNEFLMEAKKENAYEVLYKKISTRTWQMIGDAMRKCSAPYLK